MKRILFLAALILCIGTTAYAASNVTLAWDAPNPVGDVAGYRVYRSQTAGAYPAKGSANAACSSAVGTNTCTITGVNDGKWFFVATAYDAKGNESGYSNEVSTTLDTTAPGIPTNLNISVSVQVSVGQ